MLRMICKTLEYVQESYEIDSQEHDEQPNVWLPEEALPGSQRS
jgi:hypothetical protein